MSFPKMPPTTWELRETMMKLAVDARQLGLNDLAIVYNMSAIRLGTEHIITSMRRPKPGAGSGAAA